MAFWRSSLAGVKKEAVVPRATSTGRSSAASGFLAFGAGEGALSVLARGAAAAAAAAGRVPVSRASSS
ncbi:MAG: hypothetical protein KDJ23_14335, partial [Rhodoblastus sp.]|nr:hypothetical protein [Rhodoblastus sp.]